MNDIFGKGFGSTAMPAETQTLMSKSFELIPALNIGSPMDKATARTAFMRALLNPYIEYRDELDRRYVKYRDELELAKVRFMAEIDAKNALSAEATP